MQEGNRSLGRKLFEVTGYTSRLFVTDLAEPPEEIWRDYNQRAPRGGMEQRIQELKCDQATDDFCLQEFFATAVAFLSVLMPFNLLGEFQRATGMTDYRQPATLRVSRKARCGAILGRAGHRTVLRLSSAWGELEEQMGLLWSPVFQHSVCRPSRRPAGYVGGYIMARRKSNRSAIASRPASFKWPPSVVYSEASVKTLSLSRMKYDREPSGDVDSPSARSKIGSRPA